MVAKGSKLGFVVAGLLFSVLIFSIVHTFMWALVPAGLAFLFIFLMGNEKMVIRNTKKEVKNVSEN
ncbi:hypothetical protein [Bacillus sp. S14(2024)]|uniref:hypothetical protein n=1 Tax=Bacillus sp. S14(2024) TaxID=3162884 RepID=UPI003D257C0F